MTADQRKTLAEGLVPLVVNYINNEWDWRYGSTAPVKVSTREHGPSVLPPGCISDEDWSISYEGAPTWAEHFTIASNEDGAINKYLDEHGLSVECETSYAISLRARTR